MGIGICVEVCGDLRCQDVADELHALNSIYLALQSQ